MPPTSPINPFANLSADRYPVGTTLDYFEEVRAWPELHEPRNQVVFGHYGSGKSIALQRLRGSAMARKPRFLNASSFFGIYVNMLDVAFLDSLETLATADNIVKRWPDAASNIAAMKERFLTLAFAEAAAGELIDSDRREGFGSIDDSKQLATEIAHIAGLEINPTANLKNVHAAIAEARGKIKHNASTMEIFSPLTMAPGNTVRLQPALQQLAAVIGRRDVFSRFLEGVLVFFLVDQMEAVSHATQRVVNLLLRRENPFFTKVAVRVHGHSNECAGSSPLKLGDDVYPVFIGDTLDAEPEFIRVATSVANKMLRHHGDQRHITELLTTNGLRPPDSIGGLGYAGVHTFATLASGSTRLFLEMCSLAVRCAVTRADVDLEHLRIPEECQTQAAIKIARQELERVTTSDPDRGPRVRSILDRLFRDIRAKGALMPSVYKISGDLFPEDALGKDVKEVVRAGFALDAFRYASLSDATFEDLPESFGLAPVFAPAFGLSVQRGGSERIPVQDIKKMATPFRGRNSSSKDLQPGRPRLFFSTSFARRPITDLQLRNVRDVFGTEFDVKLGDSASSGNQLGKIVRMIRDGQVVLVDVSEPSPSVLLELGISYALRKRTFVTFNKDSDADITALQAFIRTLDIVPYTFDTDQLKIARDKIIQRISTDLEPGELMEENAYGMTLRPRSDERSIFVYYPRQRKVWESLRDKVQERITSLGGRLSTIEAAPHNSTSLEEIMFSVNRASRQFRASCIIDTTGQNQVDLIGSFALGAAYALKRGVVRIEESNMAKETALGLWPSPYEKWSSQDELLSIFSRYVRREEGKRNSRQHQRGRRK
jgi:hypothetical protein